MYFNQRLQQLKKKAEDLELKLSSMALIYDLEVTKLTSV